MSMTLPKVSVWSQFRDAAGPQIELYRKQITSLDYPPDKLKLYLSEGDSQDNTLAELQAWAAEDSRVIISKYDTGLAREWHTTRPQRMLALSGSGNACWDKIAADNWGEYALMLESDLLYKPDLLRLLIDRMPLEASIFSPMIWIQVKGGLRFYDVWAYRKDSEMFPPAGPEWYTNEYGESAFEVDSVGSVVLFKMSLITAGLRLSPESCILGMSNQARKQMGAKIFVDPAIHVLHPQIDGTT